MLKSERPSATTRLERPTRRGVRGNPLTQIYTPFTFLFNESTLLVCCRVLQCAAVCCVVLQSVQCVAVFYSVLQCVAVCCSVLQCVAVFCKTHECAAPRGSAFLLKTLKRLNSGVLIGLFCKHVEHFW